MKPFIRRPKGRFHLPPLPGCVLLRALVGLALLLAGTGAPTAAQSPVATLSALTETPLAPKVAPKGFDVTIVEFFDYQCPYCKRQHDALMKLLEQDKRVRVVYLDWPIFGSNSRLAARVAIAAQFQGKHAAFHDALLRGKGRLSPDTIRAAARVAKVDWQRLQADLKTHGAKIDALLTRTDRQASALGLEGTPGMLIGPYLVPGAMPLDGLKKAVALVRTNSGKSGS